MGSFSQTIGRRLRQAAGPAGSSTAASPHQEMIALASGQKLWATRVPRNEWAALEPGHELLIIRVRHQHRPFPQCVEMATVERNSPDLAPSPHLALAWGWRAPDEVDDRPAAIFYYRELAAILRYEIRNTGCPDVVATILPTPN